MRDPNAAGAESGLVRLPMPIYREAMQYLLQPILGTKLDTGRLSSLVSGGPQDDLGESGYYDPAAPSSSTLRFYLEAAEQLTAPLMKSTSFPCSADQGGKETACIDALITSSGRRAFRRPLSDAEVAALRAQYVAGRDAHDRATGIATVLRTLATSPHFVFAVEGLRTTGNSDVAALDGWEIATRLAIYLWSSVPDDALLDAVAKGELDSPAGVDAAARRMLMDKRAARGLASFGAQWLHFTDQTLSEARTEASMLLEDVVLKGDGRLASLLGSRHAFINTHLATRYGMMPPVGAPNREAFLRVDLPAERAGILTLSGVLRGNGSPTASPIKRGKMLRERLFCQEVPAAPADVPPLSSVKANTNPTLRGRLEQHRADPACSACHSFIDPIGFSFENFDWEAKHQTLDAKAAVDARGELKGTDVDGPLDGALSLVERVSRSRMVKDCVSTQMFRFALGRRDDKHDAAPLAALRETFAKSDGDLRELMVAIARSDAFRSRRTRDIAK